MQVTDYSLFVKNLFKPMDQPHNLAHAAMGIAGEAGELLDAIKKHWAYGKKLDVENVIEELGDLEFYMQALRNEIGVSRDTIIQRNIEKLSKRYASGSYSDAQAQARADKEPSVYGMAGVISLADVSSLHEPVELGQ